MEAEKLNFKIEQSIVNVPFNMPSKHYHDQLEIYYLLKGERSYFIEDRVYHLKKGDIAIIDKNILHKTNTPENTHIHERILIEFDDIIIERFNGKFRDIDLYYCFKLKHNVYSLKPDEQLWVENILHNILKEVKKKNEGYISYSHLLILELLFFLNRTIKSRSSHIETSSSQINKKISDVASFISSNYNEDLELNNIAKQFNYSPTYLSKSFKKVTGFNLVEYKNNIRIKEASNLLQNTNMNITDIAVSVGYNSLTHFGRTFKKITGFSPLEFRKVKKIM